MYLVMNEMPLVINNMYYSISFAKLWASDISTILFHLKWINNEIKNKNVYASSKFLLQVKILVLSFILNLFTILFYLFIFSYKLYILFLKRCNMKKIVALCIFYQFQTQLTTQSIMYKFPKIRFKTCRII